jgi:hypothetical protein
MPDRDGTLTSEEREKVGRWLDENWKQPRTCPVSGHDTWEISPRIVYLNAFLPTEIWTQQTLQVYPVIMAICKGCGYMLLFTARRMGIEPPPSTEEPKSVEEKKNG